MLSLRSRGRDNETLRGRAAFQRGNDDSPLLIVPNSEAERVSVGEGEREGGRIESEVASSGPQSERRGKRPL